MVHAFEGSNPSLPIPFYKQAGLRFECQRCSGCCRHTPGFVFLSRSDLTDLLSITKLTVSDFVPRFLRVVNIGGFNRISLKEKENYDCIFWENGGCVVYEKRPFQCRSFPFWNTLLESEGAWLEHKSMCPGIGKGALHSFEEIVAWLEGRIEERFLEIRPQYEGESDARLLERLIREVAEP